MALTLAWLACVECLHARSDDAQVTLSIENDDGTTTPSGWSTRKENGGNGAILFMRIASLAFPLVWSLYNL